MDEKIIKEREIRELKRNRMILVVCMGVHIFFCVLFGWGNVKPLFYYNIASVIFYFVGSLLLRKPQNTAYWLITSCIEILVHVVLCNLIMGWEYGYSIYALILIPVTYYISYMSSAVKKSLELSVLVSIVSMVVMVTSILVTREPNHLTQFPREYVMVTFGMNFILGIAVITIYSALFVQEIKKSTQILQKQNEELNFFANYDALTKLRNRRSMGEIFKVYEEKVKEYCVILGDIDDFKRINDTYGHKCGDLVLMTVAEILNTTVAETGVVCRWGGEEILILISANHANGMEIAESLRANVKARRVSYEEKMIGVSMTFGYAYCDEEKTIENLIALADARMYLGKRNGKNQVVCSE